jgi:hypothetical protein
VSASALCRGYRIERDISVEYCIECNSLYEWCREHFSPTGLLFCIEGMTSLVCFVSIAYYNEAATDNCTWPLMMNWGAVMAILNDSER